MQLKHYKPTTPSFRHKIVSANKLTRFNDKNLTIIKKSTGGRNFLGQITTRHLGGGHKQRIRLLDNHGSLGAYSIAKIENFVYAPNKTNFLSLCKTKTNKLFLRPAIEGQKIGDIIKGKYTVQENLLNPGDIRQLKHIPVGTKISNIEILEGQGVKLAKAAGVYATIIKHEQNSTILKLSSKKTIKILSSCLCTIGGNSNVLYNNTILGKAGANRWRGIRPTVRGEAMNPIDHPHGGKTSGGVRLKTVYGKLAKFMKTK